jgi:hypothetical protein
LKSRVDLLSLGRGGGGTRRHAPDRLGEGEVARLVGQPQSGLGRLALLGRHRHANQRLDRFERALIDDEWPLPSRSGRTFRGWWPGARQEYAVHRREEKEGEDDETGVLPKSHRGRN